MKRTYSDSLLFDTNLKNKCKEYDEYMNYDPYDDCKDYLFVKGFFDVITPISALLFVLFTIALPMIILPHIFFNQIMQTYLYMSNEMALFTLFAIGISYMYHIDNIATLWSRANILIVKMLIYPFKGSLSTDNINRYIHRINYR